MILCRKASPFDGYASQLAAVLREAAVWAMVPAHNLPRLDISGSLPAHFASTGVMFVRQPWRVRPSRRHTANTGQRE